MDPLGRAGDRIGACAQQTGQTRAGPWHEFLAKGPEQRREVGTTGTGFVLVEKRIIRDGFISQRLGLQVGDSLSLWYNTEPPPGMQLSHPVRPDYPTARPGLA